MEHQTPPHVVYIITKLELGGAQKVCLALMEGMHKHHISTTLISGDEGPLVEETQKFDSIILIPDFKREIRLAYFFNEIRTFINIVRLLRKLKHQHQHIIVHTHSTKAGIMGRWAAFFARIPIRIHTIHGYGFHDYQNRFIWMLIYLCELLTSFITTHFVCVSEQDRTTGSKLFPQFKNKSSLIRASAFANSSGLAVAPRKCKKFIIGTISCFKPQKNLFDLLRAFEYTYQKNKDVELQIIGDGIMRPDIETWIQTHELSNVITLVGWQKDVVPWLNSWNIFTLSSLWEGLPCTIIEARLCKLPVIAYDVGGIREVITSGVSGFLVAPGNWQALAHHFGALIHDQNLYNKMSTYADNLDDFNHTMMVKHHLKLYAQISQQMH